MSKKTKTKPIIKNRFKENSLLVFINTHLNTPFLILVFFISFTFSIYFNSFFKRPTVSEMNHGSSGAFTGPNIKDPLVVPSINDSIQIPVISTQFALEGPKPYQKIAKISFLYLCKPECQQIWLSLYTSDPSPKITKLVTHPILMDLKWLPLEDNGLYLYQPIVKYSNLSDLFKNASKAAILAEKQPIEYRFGNQPALWLEDLFTLPESVKSIVSTLVPEGYRGDWRIFTGYFPIDKATITQTGEIIWEIKQIVQDEIPIVYLSNLEASYQ